LDSLPLLKDGFLLLWRDFGFAAALAFGGVLAVIVLRDLGAAHPVLVYFFSLLLNGIFAAIWLWRLSGRAAPGSESGPGLDRPYWPAFLGLAVAAVLLPESLQLLGILLTLLIPGFSLAAILGGLGYFIFYVGVSVLAMAFVSPFLSGRLLDFAEEPGRTGARVASSYKELLLIFFLARLATIAFGFLFGGLARWLLYSLTELTLERTELVFSVFNGMAGIGYFLFNLSLGLACYRALKSSP
jgi:hypothetical protein